MALPGSAWFADLSAWNKLSVSGRDARPWLNDLVSADIDDLEPGRSRRSLLLSPTGRVRAEFTIGARVESFLLLQDPAQPTFAGDLLAKYVLSSDLQLADDSGSLALFAIGQDAPTGVGEVLTPSCLGHGIDLLTTADLADETRGILSLGHHEQTSEELELLRLEAGNPRFAVDGTTQDLPQEAGLADAVAFDKGCFLGQEAVARTRNLGHPRRVLLHLRARGPAQAGDRILSGGSESAGVVTSAARLDAATTFLLARVSWEARNSNLRTEGGVRLALA